MPPKDADEFCQRFDVPRETLDTLLAYEELVLEASETQNLVAASTRADFWQRHILDSAQLHLLIDSDAKHSLDVGSGAGLPGIVLAIMSSNHHVLAEPRRLRASFLQQLVDTLDLSSRVEVVGTRVETLRRPPFDVITARAFAPLVDILRATRHLADRHTVWLLHKGRNAATEIEPARQALDAEFELIPSLTAPDAAIIRVSALTEVRS